MFLNGTLTNSSTAVIRLYLISVNGELQLFRKEDKIGHSIKLLLTYVFAANAPIKGCTFPE